MKKVIAAMVTALFLFALAVPAASAAQVTTGTSAHVARTTVVTVKIVDFAFKPKVLEIAKGTKVKWVNKGAVGHTTTSNTGVWDSGTLAAGDTFSRTFKKAGTFKYHCSIHSSMTGKIVVG
jgi:plastocyanin